MDSPQQQPIDLLHRQFNQLIEEVKANVSRTVTESVCREIDAQAATLFNIFTMSVELLKNSSSQPQSVATNLMASSSQQKTLNEYFSMQTRKAAVTATAAASSDTSIQTLIKDEPEDEVKVQKVEQFVYTDVDLFRNGPNQSHTATATSTSGTSSSFTNEVFELTSALASTSLSSNQLMMEPQCQLDTDIESSSSPPRLYTVMGNSDGGKKRKTIRDFELHNSPGVVFFRCKEPSCGRGFQFRYQYEDHLFSAHRIRQLHTCPVPGCGKMFRDRDKLRRHERIHNGIRPYHCTWPGCGYDAVRKDHVLSHVKKVHFRLRKSMERTAKDPRHQLYIGVDEALLRGGQVNV